MEQASWMFPGWCRLVILGEELLEQAAHCSSRGLPVLGQLQPQAEVQTDIAAFKLSFIHSGFSICWAGRWRHTFLVRFFQVIFMQYFAGLC